MHNSDMEALNSAKSGCSALSVTFEGMNLTTAAAVMITPPMILKILGILNSEVIRNVCGRRRI